MLENTRAPHLVGAAFVTLLALALLALGALALWADSRKDADGYLGTDAHGFATPSRALATTDLDFDGLDGALTAGDDAGRVRFTAESDRDKPVFVGIARARDVSAYLRGVAHARVSDISTAPFRPHYDRHPGAGRPALPGTQRFWAASAHGTGRQAIEWDARDGSWSVVVMNADGSPGVAADVSAGGKAPFLGAVGWGALGAGLLTLTAAAALMVRGARRPRARPGAPSASTAG
jgi:hypothetical protein